MILLLKQLHMAMSHTVKHAQKPSLSLHTCDVSPVQMPAEQAWLGDRATWSVCSLSVHGPALKNCFRNLLTTLQSTKQVSEHLEQTATPC